MIGFSWQQAGAFSAVLENLSHEKVDEAIASGIRWIAPVLMNDRNAADNQSRVADLRAHLDERGNVAGWFNGWGDDPVTDAKDIYVITKELGLAAIILDLEAAYCYPSGCWTCMPDLITEVRKHFSLGTKAVAVTSFGFPVNSMIWTNLHKNNVKYLPQWYSSYYAKDGRYSPISAVKYVRDFGTTDPNILGGIRVSDIHGVLECSSMEGSSLAREMADVRAAKAYGYTKGFSLYNLENASSEDLALVKAAVDLRL